MKNIIALLFLLLSCFTAQADILQQQPYDVVMGDEAAPVTVVEYFSLSCPHCADFQEKIFPKIKEQYIDTGKIKFIARPYANDDKALLGSQLLKCVPSNRYYVFMKVLLAMQKEWVFSGDAKSNLKTIAGVGGFSSEDFDKCYADKANEELVLNIVKQINDEKKIEAIPTFFINGVEAKGAGSLEQFSKVIDEQIAASKK
jgi:protein-disulfide isomerase